MSSSRSSTQSDSASAASDALTPPAETVRSCADRERRLTEYIRAHTGEDIAVRLTPHVPTACVIPTSEEALIDSDNAEFSDDEARQLVESVDADYLVLISTHPANVDNLPIDDQLTADRAQQFGYALHELGHIRYTAIADAAARLEDRVDEDHQEFVHGLWNSCEDAAIENQLALDQSQLAADRLELVSRSISPHADGVADDDCYEHTFRDAIDVALYDTGIYDTGIRDALCDPDNSRFVFASDADQQAFEQVAVSIDELVGTVLSTPDAVERVEHVLDWWETTIKPLLDPSEQQQQESEQPDPAGAGGESSADGGSSSNSNTSRSTGSSDGCGTDQSIDESADADHSSSESETDQNGEGTADTGNPAASPEDAERDTSATADEPGEADETDGPTGSQSETRPDPDAINTDQRQSSPGTDALDYPDIGGDENATALQQPQSTNEGEAETEPESKAASESDGKNEREGEPEPQSSGDSTENAQTADDDNISEGDFNTDTSAETPAETGGESVDDSGSGDESLDRDNADSFARADTDGRSVGEGEGGEAAGGNDDTTSRAEASSNGEEQSNHQTAGSESHGDGNGTDEATESPEQGSEGGDDGPPGESHSQQNPWRADDSTDQSTLGSFSTAETTPSENDVNASNDGRSGESGDSDETPTTTPDSERDGPSPDVGDASESGSESELELEAEADESGTEDGSDATPADTGAGTDADVETDRSENITHEEGDASDNRSSGGSGNDTNANTSAAREQRGDTPDETQSEADEQPTVPTPVHADEEGLDRDGALDTDHDAAHDEADRATPDEQALECELADVADALDALAEQDGGGAAPGSLSELTIMPDVGESITTDTAERWDKAAADAEFVADTLRKALKESRRDAHRSGVTSGTFDRQRAGALARGDVGAFHVRQPGDDKQYDLVMILDRSGSMRKHIQTAENVLVRFALACEDIGINVGVIDFFDDDARLVKPFSVECEHVRGSFLSSQYGGNTPLADALGLGRELLEQRRNTPLVIVVTDGKPGDEDAYHDELAQAYAPVCGLTLVLDQSSGSVPEKVARNERFYDRHVYVHGPSQLADRLDQFAVMFDGL
jgi:hypothetical protein